MKISVSLPPEDLAFLDEYARTRDLRSRSAALHRAVALLRAAQLGDDYEAAWDEWQRSGEADLWDATAADGLGDDASR